MADVERVFKSCILNLTVPEASLDLPATSDNHCGDEWLNLISTTGEREKAYFDEKLIFYLTIHVEHLSEKAEEQPSPPVLLLTFLNHTQVSLEATYISRTSPESYTNGHLTAPPVRSSSAGLTAKPKNLDASLTIYPPQTPSPIPSTTEADKKYIHSEGTLLKAFVWGEGQATEDDSFRLLWSKSRQCWLAVYKLSIVVAFVRTSVPDPLLCLTSSVTLRDKPLPPTPQRQTLTALINEFGPLHSLIPHDQPTGGKNNDKSQIKIKNMTDIMWEEINLLDGVLVGPGATDKLHLPAIRLGSFGRQAYSLPPLSPIPPVSSSPNPSQTIPVLRKSFRKTVQTASGFHVRMRTVFIPQIYIPSDTENEQDAANEENTVVLCVEIENSGESGAGFSVESISVSISGEGAKIRLISWGEKGLVDPLSVFPILIRSAEQYNLLYAVSFLRPAEFDLSDVSTQERINEFQRAVSIHIIGRPFLTPAEEFAQLPAPSSLMYPTSAFLSRWNCVLDLTPKRDRGSLQASEDFSSAARSAFPYPASPFPIPSPHAQHMQEQSFLASTAQTSTTAGLKRHTFAGSITSRLHTDLQSASYRPMSLNSAPNRVQSPNKQNKFGRRPGQSGALSPPLPPLPLTSAASGSTQEMSYIAAPPTPAFPSYSNGSLTPRPNSITPSFGQVGSVGQGVDVRREKYLQMGVPQTPAPRLMPGERIPMRTSPSDFVISVSLVHTQRASKPRFDQRLLHPLEEFSLEIFVFNRSQYTRSLEATYPDRKRRRDEMQNPLTLPFDKWKPAPPAFMPLESRIQIGPLPPSFCQSVNMHFLAISPGVHRIDGLILTDVETGDAVHLRSVMEFAILDEH